MESTSEILQQGNQPFVLCTLLKFLVFQHAADNDRVDFMTSFSLGHGMMHTVQRSDIFSEVVALYAHNKEEILQEFPFHVSFKGERAVDLGGVARDMFSALFEAAYEHLFDGGSLLYPIVHPEMDVCLLSTVGFIISHAYMVSGILPIRITFPCLAQCLLGTTVTVPHSAIVEPFKDSLSTHEASVFRSALEEAKQEQPTFSSPVMNRLLPMLSRFNSRQMPSPKYIRQQVYNVTTYEFLTKPTAALTTIYSGIPEQHHSFWNRMGIAGLLSLYIVQSVCPATVLYMIEDAEGQNAIEERVLGYLRQYIGNMGSDDLRMFLRFTTGSSVCSALKIEVNFNMLSGACR